MDTNTTAFMNVTIPPTKYDKISEYDLSLQSATDKLYIIYTFVLFIPGFIGNLLALIVILQKTMRGVSSAVLIATLAVADNVTLIGFLLTMLSYKYTPEIANGYSCKILQFIPGFGSLSSAWIVVAITIERSVIVSMPLKSHTLTGRRKMGIAVSIILICCFLHSIYYFWVVVEQKRTCQLNEKDYVTFLKIYMVYDAVMACILPTILVFIINIVIIVAMRRTHYMVSNTPGHNRTNQTRQLTGMLLSISVCFFFCMLPISVMQIWFRGIYDEDHATKSSLIRIELATQVCQMMWMLNHSINFVLYCLTGKKFRSTLLQLLKCRKHVQIRQSAITSVSKTMESESIN